VIAAWLAAQAWKIGTGVASAAALGLSVALMISQAQHGADVRKIASHEETIRGLGAMLTQCRENTTMLEGAIRTQNTAIATQAAEGAKRLAAAEQGLATAQAATLAAERRIGVLMRPLVGADTCQRMIEMDERVLEDLK
jgi:hypothetical protein